MDKSLRVFLLIFLAIFTYNAGFSQETTETMQPKRPLVHQVGININNLVQTTLGVRQDSANSSPYLVTYRISRGAWGLRFGLGGYLNHEIDQESGFADKIVTDRSGISARVGLEHQKSVHPRWMVAYGADVNLNSRLTATSEDSGFDVIETVDQNIEFGFGPSLGIYFGITKRLSLFTEASLIAAYTQQDKGRTFKNFPELNDNLQTIKAFRVRTVLPANLYLVYQF